MPMPFKITAAITLLALGAALPSFAGDIETRLTPAEITAMPKLGAGAGTSGVTGIQTLLLYGDPAKAGPYVIRLVIPANTHIRAHTHRDTRTATVISGLWHFGYGQKNDPAVTKALPAGSFYTEPADVAHFASTTSEGAVVEISGYGPSDTVYVEAH